MKRGRKREQKNIFEDGGSEKNFKRNLKEEKEHRKKIF